MTHTYTDGVPPEEEESIEPDKRVEVVKKGGRVEVRRFSLQRARLMDRVLPAIERCHHSMPGNGIRGRDNKLLVVDLGAGDYMKIALQPIERPLVWRCLSAHPGNKYAFDDAIRHREGFPPGK